MTLSPTVMKYVVDPLERAGRTFIQQLSVLLLPTIGAGVLVGHQWAIAADSALFAALISILTSVLTFKVPALSAPLDLALRCVKTFVQSFLGSLVAAHVLSVVHADWKGALAVAVPVTVSAFVMGLAAMALPTTKGASLLPAHLTSGAAADPGAARHRI